MAIAFTIPPELSPVLIKMRVGGTKSEPLFSFDDVCQCLGCTAQSAVRTLPDDAPKIGRLESESGGLRGGNCLDILGVDHLTRVFDGALLRRWLLYTVVPSIKNYGAYPPPAEAPTKAIHRLGPLIPVAKPDRPEKFRFFVKEGKAFFRFDEIKAVLGVTGDVAVPDDDVCLSFGQVFVGERFVFEMFLKSDAPAAQRLRSWLGAKVLPALFECGSYPRSGPSMPFDDIGQCLADFLADPEGEESSDEESMLRTMTKEKATSFLRSVPAKGEEQDPEVLRGLIIEIVNAWHFATGQPSNVGWQRLYYQLEAETGFDPRALKMTTRGSLLGITFLEGRIGQLYAVAIDMMVVPVIDQSISKG